MWDTKGRWLTGLSHTGGRRRSSAQYSTGCGVYCTTLVSPTAHWRKGGTVPNTLLTVESTALHLGEKAPMLQCCSHITMHCNKQGESSMLQCYAIHWTALDEIERGLQYTALLRTSMQCALERVGMYPNTMPRGGIYWDVQPDTSRLKAAYRHSLIINP